MAVMQTTMIRASITAYSTAVGPSSFVRKFATLRRKFRMFLSFPIPKSSEALGRERPDPESGLASFTEELGSLRSLGDGCVERHVGERRVGVVAEGGDGRDADH